MAPDRLFWLLRTVATTSLQPLSSRFQCIDSATNCDGFDIAKMYEFYIVAAGIWLALRRREQLLDGEDSAAALVSIAGNWDEQVEEALRDIDRFVEVFDKEEKDLITAVGAWVIWNLKKSAPQSDEEFSAAHAIGFSLGAALHEFRK